MKLLKSGLKLSSMHGEKDYNHNNNFNVLNEAAYFLKRDQRFGIRLSSNPCLFLITVVAFTSVNFKVFTIKLE